MIQICIIYKNRFIRFGNEQTKKETFMSKAFVYTELQASIPFNKVPWQEIGAEILKQPGFINKTWLAGIETNSVGGFYEFDSIENAKKFVTSYFPKEAKKLGSAQTTRIFDGSSVEQASRFLNSMHFGGQLNKTIGAFVYTEVQISVPFEKAPWMQLNPVLKSQPGLLHKTWLSGYQNNSVGGFYAFDSVENAKKFAIDYFPKEAAGLNAGFTTRIFDAAIVKQASSALKSPFVTK